MDTDGIETVTVDSYTTLVDVDAQEAVPEERVDDLGDLTAVSRLWRNTYIRYSMEANVIDQYRPL